MRRRLQVLWYALPLSAMAQTQPEYATFISGNRQEEVIQVAAAPDGGTVVLGNTSSTGAPWDDEPAFRSGFVIRYDSEGRIVLRRRWPDLVINSASLDADGGFVIAGPANHAFLPTEGAWMTTQPEFSASYMRRIAPDGTVRSGTYFPGSVSALTVDGENHPVICGATLARDFPITEGAFATNTLRPFNTGFCSKLSPDLSKLLASTYLNAPGGTVSPASIAIDTDGAWLVTGSTDARWWELMPGFQSEDRRRTLFRLGEGWSAPGDTLDTVQRLIVDAADPNRLYVSAGGQKLSSVDGGVTWVPLLGMVSTATEFAVHPRDSRYVAAIHSSGQLRYSSDGGETSRAIPLFAGAGSSTRIFPDPAEPGFFYIAGTTTAARVGPAGVDFQASLQLGIRVEPLVARVPDDDSMLAIQQFGALVVTDTRFRIRRTLADNASQVWVAPSDRKRFYLRRRGSPAPGFSIFARTDDGGATWRDLPDPPVTSNAPIVSIHPGDSGTLYIASADAGVYLSRDAGETWTRVEDPPNTRIAELVVDRSGTLWLVASRGQNGFIGRFSPDAKQLLSASIVGGSGPSSMTSAVPAGDGRYWIAGTTNASDFPVSGKPLHSVTRFDLSGFAGLFETGGATLRRTGLSSTQFVVGPDGRVHIVGSNGDDVVLLDYDPATGESNAAGRFGGSGYDGETRIALGNDGRLRIAGRTASIDFPVTPNAAEPKTVESNPELAVPWIDDAFLFWLSLPTRPAP
jgi:hypothetical protein